MLNKFKETEEIFYLIDVGTDYDGNTYFNPLSKAWSSNNFTPVPDIERAYKFKSLEDALKMCKIQNMFNEGFGSNNKAYVIQSNVNNTIQDDSGQTVSPQDIGEPKEPDTEM